MEVYLNFNAVPQFLKSGFLSLYIAKVLQICYQCLVSPQQSNGRVFSEARVSWNGNPSVCQKNHKLCILFSSQSLKHLSFTMQLSSSQIGFFDRPSFAATSTWELPTLTTLDLRSVTLCNDEADSIGVFSKCVNLKNLTLKEIKTMGSNGLSIIQMLIESFVYFSSFTMSNFLHLTWKLLRFFLRPWI